MPDAGATLGTWSSFYVMIGSSAAALTGLMFVVITLAGSEDRNASKDGISTFSTPTVVHFCGALFISALMSMPFRSLVPLATVLGLAGAGGMVYVARIARRTSTLQTYRPDAEDWICNVVLPLLAYAALLAGAIAMRADSRAFFGPAAAVLLLIFVGIHNAWDVVTFLATGQHEALPDGPSDAATPAGRE